MGRKSPRRQSGPTRRAERVFDAAPPRPPQPDGRSEPSPIEPSGNTPFPIVGIGASAGGLEAFSQLLKALPTDTGMAFVLVQHLDPRHESQLPDVLSRTTAMPVIAVTNRLRAEPDHVYVIPSNADMTIGSGVLYQFGDVVRSVSCHCSVN